MDLQALIDQAVGLWTEAREIWLSGGWAMIAISVIALVMFSVGMGLHFKLRAKGFGGTSGADEMPLYSFVSLLQENQLNNGPEKRW